MPKCILRLLGRRLDRDDKNLSPDHEIVSHDLSESLPISTKPIVDELTPRSGSMLSALFQDTVAQLTPSEQTRLNVILDRIAQHPPLNENGDGSIVRRHIETERQLPREQFVDFLRALLSAIPDENVPAINETYDSVSRNFVYKGRPIQATPTILYRYISAYNLLRGMASSTKTTNPELATELEQRSVQARRGEISWKYVLQDIVDCNIWEALPLDKIRLTSAGSMFVTFDCESQINRGSTTIVWHALALWKPKPENLVEIQILVPTAEDNVPRIPTLADAGWYSFFCCADETEHHGWTKPHNHTPELPRQPEAVLRPLMLSSVSSAACLRVLDP